MFPRRASLVPRTSCRTYSHVHGLRPVPILPDATIETFRQQAFEANTPARMPPKYFRTLPAIGKWFVQADDKTTLKRSYLSHFGSTIVPLEISNDDHFSRTEQSLSFFLECVNASSLTSDTKPNRCFGA